MTNCEVMSSSIWRTRRRCWCWTIRVSAGRAAIQLEWRANTEEAIGQLQLAYGRLLRLTVASKTQAQAATVGVLLQSQSSASAQRLLKPFKRFLPRMAQVIDQTVRRVGHREMVPALDMLASLPLYRTPRLSCGGRPASPCHVAARCGWQKWKGSFSAALESLQKQDKILHICQTVLWPMSSALADLLSCGPPTVGSSRPLTRPRRSVIPDAGKTPPTRVARERTTWFRPGLRCRAGIEGRINVLSRTSAWIPVEIMAKLARAAGGLGHGDGQPPHHCPYRSLQGSVTTGWGSKYGWNPSGSSWSKMPRM
jgi:transposase, IS5 family